ncbi:LysR family transcriptional regulator [uncultured Massilia sp.]|uniref:LysR family transcriptional regulator n=1 Tax=uncultured Massilia sp. TaxID=169973 RepID=UPI0025FDFA3B|nr:LysR family transcriptional regulator [uncultured Massilia sp.]
MDQLLAIRTFVRIAESGSFGKAADQLEIPRSTASKLIQDLEQMLGARLVQRTTRQATVTPEGAAYYERALRLLAELEEMDAEARRTRAQPRGRLRVGIGSSLANFTLIPRLPAFTARYPDIQLQLGVSDRPADMVGEGIDCVIRAGVLAESSLIARKLCDLEFVICAHRSYVERHGLPAHPAELQDGRHHIVGYYSSLTGRPIDLRFERDGETVVVQPRSGVAVNESTAHLTALVAGLGIAQNFRHQVQPWLERGELVLVFPEWRQPPHPLYAMYPQNRHLNAKARVFIDWAVEVFATIDARAGR